MSTPDVHSRKEVRMELVTVTGALLLLLGVALARASSRGRRIGEDVAALVELSHIHSRSGMPFFATDDAVWNLSAELDDTQEARSARTRHRGAFQSGYGSPGAFSLSRARE
jgi:hypothetical protein